MLHAGGLSTHFARYINERGLRPAPVHGPSPLLSPSAVITAQLEALQRNDWPDADAGVRTAHRFALPHSCRPVRRRRVRRLHPQSCMQTAIKSNPTQRRIPFYPQAYY